ncbi:MAG: 50S ribosomal protein L5 [Candidatus Tectomicrobia bacterium]|nr:50S ribosomal protein L5 [Candidatus Tectomicrobia bacterium]
MAYVSRMRRYFQDEVVSAMQRQFEYDNVMKVPRLQKIVLNMGLGEAINNAKLLDAGVEQLRLISGQQPVITKARRSIAAYKLRTGMSIGVKVTLRRDRMYDFLDRLVSIALPRVRDFRGVDGNAFDGRGNYTLGVEEQIIFPEVDYDKVERIKGLSIAVVTSAQSDAEGKELLRLLGMPFRN